MLAESLLDLVDDFVVSEINVSEYFLHMFSLNGYRCCSITRTNRRGGGIAIFVNSGYDTSLVNFTFRHAECFAVKVHCVNHELLLLALYRPPSNSATRFLLGLEEALKGRSSIGQVCLAGDFNINIICPTNTFVSEYLSVLAS